jgi:hypothetical protein
MIGAAPFAAIAFATFLSSLRRRVAAPAACLAFVLIVFGFVRNDRVEPVSYEGVAQALVELGWTASDPIVVRGNLYAFRGPLEWYLPNRPRLSVGEAVATPCPRLYVVAPTRALDGETPPAASQQLSSRRVRALVVARFDRQSPKALGRLLRRSHLLVAMGGRTRCVREVPEGTLGSPAQ